MDKSKKITLADFSRKRPFEVPKDYFEQFSATIETEISTPQHKKIWTISRTWLYMVAMFVGIAVVGYSTGLLSIFKPSSSIIISEVSDYENYVLSQVDAQSVGDYYYEEEIE